jgi:hypothetical protein
MPQKIQMLIYKGNQNSFYQQQQRQINAVNLTATQSIAAPKAPSSLAAPIISRIHTVKPGCGSCGRH